MVLTYFTVQSSRRANAVTCQNVHDSPNTDPVAVISNRPVAHVGNLGMLAGDALVGVARHDIVKPKEFDVRIYPKGDPCAVRPFQFRSLTDRDIIERTVSR